MLHRMKKYFLNSTLTLQVPHHVLILFSHSLYLRYNMFRYSNHIYFLNSPNYLQEIGCTTDLLNVPLLWSYKRFQPLMLGEEDNTLSAA